MRSASCAYIETACLTFLQSGKQCLLSGAYAPEQRLRSFLSIGDSDQCEASEASQGRVQSRPGSLRGRNGFLQCQVSLRPRAHKGLDCSMWNPSPVSSRRNKPVNTAVLRRGLTGTPGSQPGTSDSRQGAPGPVQGEKKKQTKQNKILSTSVRDRQ